MIKRLLYLLPMLLDKHIKLCVDVVLAKGLIHGLPVQLGLLHLLHFATAVFPLLLQLFYVLHDVAAVVVAQGRHGFLLLLHPSYYCVTTDCLFFVVVGFFKSE